MLSDQLLEQIGRKDAITEAFTIEDAQSNSQILNRIYNKPTGPYNSQISTDTSLLIGQIGQNGGQFPPAPHVIQTTSYVPSTGPGTDAQHSGVNMHEHAAFPKSSQTKRYIQAVKIADQRRGGGVYRITSTFRAGDHGSDHSKGSMENPFAVDVAPNLDLPYTQEAETAWRNQFHADLNAIYDEMGWPKPDFIVRGN